MERLPEYLTLERKMRLEKALRDVEAMNGSKDIIMSLRIALKEYNKGINFDTNLWSLSYRQRSRHSPPRGSSGWHCETVG